MGIGLPCNCLTLAPEWGAGSWWSGVEWGGGGGGGGGGGVEMGACVQVVASQFRFRPSVANSQLSWGQPRGQNCLECPDFGEGVNQTQS